MIPPVEKPQRIILSKDDLPKVEHTSNMRVIRARYLDVLWELAVDSDNHSARLSCIAHPASGNTEVASLISKNIDFIGVEVHDLRRQLEQLIDEFAHRDFVSPDPNS